ncbi:MAG: RusA family crossover junction endodeoxyribonuclease, partial [Rhodospirillaceae bacterium]|nr:RusA family crossover junction endodeoxyribonuclease [Rhodospirillaceae bacterium]
KAEWQEKVLAAAQSEVGYERWALMEERLSVSMYYFPQDPMPGDVDNIVKLTLDALAPNIYTEDHLIDRILVQRFNPEVSFSFADPSDTLVEAMTIGSPVLYVCIDEAPLRDLAQ